MDRSSLPTVAGWTLAAALAGFLFYDRLSQPSLKTPVVTLPSATVHLAQTPSPVAEAPPISSPTPSVLEMLNSRFPATAAGHVPTSTTEIRPEPTIRVAAPDPVRETTVQPPPPPTRSSLDLEREKAAILIPTLERMTANAQELGAIETEWRSLCVGVIAMPYVDPYGNQVAGTMEKEKTPECLSRKARLTELKASLPKDSAEVQEMARRSGVLPGILRELAAKYQLEAYLRP
ncbi:MAG: hypothetical protein ABI672_06655 [Vicinamibacteria bacterium]